MIKINYNYSKLKMDTSSEYEVNFILNTAMNTNIDDFIHTVNISSLYLKAILNKDPEIIKHYNINNCLLDDINSPYNSPEKMNALLRQLFIMIIKNTNVPSISEPISYSFLHNQAINNIAEGLIKEYTDRYRQVLSEVKAILKEDKEKLKYYNIDPILILRLHLPFITIEERIKITQEIFSIVIKKKK